MEHSHNILDQDPSFVIDPITRLISARDISKTRLMQHDHNSERFTFVSPRYIEEHDMSQCDKIEIHYINTDSRKRSSGIYEVDDLVIDPSDNNKIKFSWLISHNATLFVGSLQFAVRFRCTKDSDVVYAWGTAINTDVEIGTSITNEGAVVEQYADAIEDWYKKLLNAGIDGVKAVQDAKDEVVASVKSDETVNELVALVISRLPYAEGETF